MNVAPAIADVKPVDDYHMNMKHRAREGVWNVYMKHATMCGSLMQHDERFRYGPIACSFRQTSECM